MIVEDEIAKDLRAQLTLYREILSVIEREGQCYRTADGPALDLLNSKKGLLARLDESLQRLKHYRIHWQRLSAEDRARCPEIGPLIRQNQELIMKSIVLDRENEQTLLRRGLVPAQHLPAVNRQRPHYVADLYRRNQGT